MLLPLSTSTIVSLDEKDRLALGLELTPDQIRGDLASPTLRHLVARIKQSLMLNQDAFFSPTQGAPLGLNGASVREAYTVGLVSFGKQVLTLVEELRREGSRPEPQPEKRAVDPFKTGVPK